MQNCLITRHFQRIPEKNFDVVLFVGEDDVVRYVQSIESTRTPNQIYAVILAEPPHIVPDLSSLGNKINWTVGYRTDADVKFSYGSVFDKQTKNEVPYDPMWRGFDDMKMSDYIQNSNIPQIVRGKSKMVAWFVSNCNKVKSNRMALAEALGKHIAVDIYGDCGTLKCDREDEQCYKMLETDYRFYLSFENALCKDYITEKVFGVMKRRIIPVLLNGADIAKVLPPKSYINAEDYATPEDLAKHLLFLANNPEEYLKYFWWREFYYIKEMHYSCYLCQKLNGMKPGTEIVPYENLERWHKTGVCRKPRIVF